MNIVGYLAWSNRMEGSVVMMRGLLPTQRLGVSVVGVIAIVSLGWGLSLIEGQHTPYVDANTFFFADTNAITTYMYALDYHHRVPPYVSQLAMENAQRYDLFFLCDDDIPYEDTWDRSGPQKRNVYSEEDRG